MVLVATCTSAKSWTSKSPFHSAVAAEEWCRVNSSSTSKYKRYINILLSFIIIIIIIIVRRQIVSSLCLSCHTLLLFHFLIDLPKIFQRFCGTYTLSYEFFYSLLSLKCLIKKSVTSIRTSQCTLFLWNYWRLPTYLGCGLLCRYTPPPCLLPPLNFRRMVGFTKG